MKSVGFARIMVMRWLVVITLMKSLALAEMPSQ